MGYKKLLDMHMHTDNSPDGEAAVMYMCEKAQQFGLRAIAFTDHCEVDDYRDNKDNVKRINQAYFEGKKAQIVYRGRLIISVGIEMGQPTFDQDAAQQILAEHDYDIVLASLHNLRNHQDFYYIEYDKVDVRALLEEYFAELLGIVKWGNFDSLAHLTYPIRYITGKYHIPVDLKEYSDYTDEIFKLLAQSGKALEINTSGLRQPLGETLPGTALIKRFRALGGELITIGSDAHKAIDVGSGIQTTMQIAKDCGFDYVTLYQSRMAVPIAIE